jgi:hypothetical protein
MTYEAMAATQWDEVMNFEPIVADDFQFEEDTTIDDFHWVGGYWNGDLNAEFNWSIVFYEDRGDNAPGAVIAGPFVFTQAQCNPQLLEDTGSSIYYKYTVNFTEYIQFNAGVKYWVSAQGIGLFPPQSGFAYHQTPIKLSQCMFKSEFFGFPDWNESETVFGVAVDLCFQITREEDNEDPTVEIISPVKAFYINGQKLFDRIFGLPFIIGDFTIEATATDNKGIEKVEFYAGLSGDELLGNVTEAPYNFTWTKGKISLIHLHNLKVIAYDYSGNTASDSMYVKKFL